MIRGIVKLQVAPALLFTVAISGCADEAPPPPPVPPAAPSAWHVESGSAVVGVPKDVHDQALAAAVAQARASAEKARERFASATAEDRKRWWIKWASPTAANGVEHVWVQPLTWSPFRVEGVLVSKPVAELASGKNTGDLVSFPIEELSDWIHFTGVSANPTLSDPHEGGFTVKALESKYGRP